jgi:16S rRNA (cytidine1402-2'-O)-methyltransferase
MSEDPPQRRPEADTVTPSGRIEPGLHLVSTPIGAARDITLRALDILRGADVLAAEDTRSLRRLMEIHGVPLAGRPLLAYHDHNGPAMRPRLMAALADGHSLAYAPEAGTPLVADPGYQLVRAALAAGHAVRAAPGPSAALAALAVSGLPSDRFLFAGFPPPQRAARQRWAEELRAVPATLILFESPRRVRETLGTLCEVWGKEREAALCRELTKRFEEVRRGTLGALAEGLSAEPRGEIVLVVDRDRRGQSGDPAAAAIALAAALRAQMRSVSLKEAVARVAADLGLPRRQVYQAALALGADVDRSDVEAAGGNVADDGQS